MRVGVVGGGQLGRMLGQAGLPLGLRCTFLDPDDTASAGAVGPVRVAEYADRQALEALARDVDVVTYEFENVPVDAACFLAERIPVYPSPRALDVAQDRLVEKTFFRDHGVPTAPFLPVDDLPGLQRAIEALGLPAILKTRRGGYDGKGQQYLVHEEQAGPAWVALGGQPCILERVVPFDRELSVLGVRGRDGEVRCWPLVENRHAGGILRWSVAPAPGVGEALQAEAGRIARQVLESLDYVGVIAVELFQLGDRLLANEMAPRVHNSGHWTIEGADTSQFENHLRAVCGLPLGETGAPLPSACVNLLGRVPPLDRLLAIPGAHVHLYDKLPRAGRKLGHVTVRGTTLQEVQARLAAVRDLLLDGTAATRPEPTTPGRS